MPLINEVVRLGNSTGRIKNIFANGLIIIHDIRGDVGNGSISFTCDDSGETITFSNFEIADKYDQGYEEKDFYLTDPKITSLDSGSFIALDAHFTGKSSQHYQTKNIVIVD